MGRTLLKGTKGTSVVAYSCSADRSRKHPTLRLLVLVWLALTVCALRLEAYQPHPDSSQKASEASKTLPNHYDRDYNDSDRKKMLTAKSNNSLEGTASRPRPVQVPEPASLLLVGVGLVSIATLVKRRHLRK